MTSERTGSLIGGVFGLLYVMLNAGALPSPAAAVLQALAAAAFAGLLLTMRRVDGSSPSGVRPRAGFGRSYWLVVAAEVVALAAGLLLLEGPLDRPQAAVAWVSLVVGLHFFALARIWKEPFFRRLGGAISLLGAAGLAAASASASEAVIATVTGVAPGVLLLLAGYRGALSGHNREVRDATRQGA